MVAGAPAHRPFGLDGGERFHLVIGAESRRRPLGHWIVLSLTVFALFLLVVLSRTALDRNAFVLQDLERRIAVEEARYWELRLQVSGLRDPGRIARMAAEMGMVYPIEVRAVDVPGLGSGDPGMEQRWLTLKTLLSAQP